MWADIDTRRAGGIRRGLDGEGIPWIATPKNVQADSDSSSHNGTSVGDLDSIPSKCLGVFALCSPTALSMTTSQSPWRPPAHWVPRCGCQTVTYLGKFPGFVNRCRIGTSAAVVPIVALIPQRPRG